MAELIDLHVHSTFSDGTMTPTELVRYAKKKGLKAIAITDHDTVNGIEEALIEGQKLGVEIVPGVEITCDYGREVHVLGLELDYKSDHLKKKLAILCRDREVRNLKVINRLNELGYDITLEEVKKAAYDEMILRPHIAAVMVTKGYASSIREAFNKFLGEGKPAYFKKGSFEASKAIELIKKAKGIPIIAHPGLLKAAPQETEMIIVELKTLGLEGIEVFHSDHDEQTTKMLLGIAKKHNLLISGGSDFHGTQKVGIDLGEGRNNLRVEYKLLERIKEFKESGK